MSTNRIATELGMSPGNLYYHYADKQQIIRALVAAMIEHYAQLWAADDLASQEQPLARLGAAMARGSELAWKYRFFGREQLALLRADPELATMYRDAYRARMAQWEAFADQLVERGLLQPRSPLPDLTAAIWLVAENWMSALEIIGDADDPAQVARQADLVFAVLEPHLTASGRELWEVAIHGAR